MPASWQAGWGARGPSSALPGWHSVTQGGRSSPVALYAPAEAVGKVEAEFLPSPLPPGSGSASRTLGGLAHSPLSLWCPGSSQGSRMENRFQARNAGSLAGVGRTDLPGLGMIPGIAIFTQEGTPQQGSGAPQCLW